ncbi:sigma-54-dependent transcriptional regulator [Terriglobus aquaticus]|uniref:Sigma-54-dependent transcriptional regulator n=1 Tax=Terriglobus aquaticus TaxID=940139 RepID=A0ABW9KKU3_9BACT|nr:sigma-54 dependent transcriptional regulator [Terriglobus aquaticus]
MPPKKVLVVEDEANARAGLAELITSWGYRTEAAADGAAGFDMAQRWSPDIVVSDLMMPRMDGLQLLDRLSELPQSFLAVILTAHGAIDSAVTAMRMGAFDYLQKPVDPAKLKTILQNASEQIDSAPASAEGGRPATGAATTDDMDHLGPLVGRSQAMQSVFRTIERIAPTNVSVLITGESGTGKELAARALHQFSGRKNKPFVAVNCAAIPETLIESEIFGHERGAFTGAQERRAGCFELAEDGTLLLDEIGEMPAATQAKLLRVLEDRKLRRLGAREETPVNVRVIAATNKDPQQAVASGELRGDLYYRLNVFHIQMPALRDHAEDIPLIAAAMLTDMNQRHGTSVPGITPQLLARLQSYPWPGNARELRNTMERAVILAGNERLALHHLPEGFGEAGHIPPPHQAAPAASHPPISASIAVPTSQPGMSAPDVVEVAVGTTVDEAEKQLILKTLVATRNNKTRAAEILGISSKTLQNKLKEYNSDAGR